MATYDPNSVRNRTRRRLDAYRAYGWNPPALRDELRYMADNPQSYRVEPHHVDSVRDRVPR